MGGHLTELMQLKSIFKCYDYKLVTEKHKSTVGLKARYKSKIDYLLTGNKDHMLRYICRIRSADWHSARMRSMRAGVTVE